MKQSLIVIIIILMALCPEKVSGQFLDGGSTRIFYAGAKAGGNFNQFSQPGSAIMGNAGIFVRFQITPYLQVQGELLYDVIGGGRRDLFRDLNFINNSGTRISHVTYLNRHVYLHTTRVPLTLRLGIPDLRDTPFEPRFVIGGSYAYMFYASETRDSQFTVFNPNNLSGSNIILSNRKENVTNDYYTNNIAIHGGFELDFQLDNGQVFTFGIIYSQGITDLNDIRLGQPENIEVLKSRSIGINFSYSIF